MTAIQVSQFRRAVHALHCAKSQSYRDAWKKRGEVIGVVANIARKVDRIEYALDGAESVADESLLDTSIDLFVYCLKYQTFLADLDSRAANALYGDFAGNVSYSDGTVGFDYLLEHMEIFHEAPEGTLEQAGEQILQSFAKIEESFAGLGSVLSVDDRLARAKILTKAAISFTLTVMRDRPGLFAGFLKQYSDKGKTD